jgi:hypothetical protein
LIVTHTYIADKETPIHLNKSLHYGKLFCLCMILLLQCVQLQAQDEEKKKKKIISGVLGAKVEGYNYKSTDSLFKSSYLPLNYRFYVNANVKLHEKLTLPFSFTYSKRQFNTVLPQLPEQTPLEYIQDPRNNVGFHPTYDEWATLHIGTHSPSFSELSTGSTPIFGLGFELKPKNFRLAGSRGYTNLAVEHDTSINALGAYKRLLTAFKIGVGKEEKSNVNLNFVKAKDVASSIYSDSTILNPQEGIVISLDYKIVLSKHLKLYGEIAGSAFTNSLLQDETVDPFIPFIPEGIYKTNNSSRFDASAFSSLDLGYKKWGLVFTVKQIGAGYKSLSYPYMLTDYRDFTVNPRVMLLNSKIIVNGTIGYRTDNLSKTKIATNETVLINSSININAIKNLGIGLSYTNFGQENSIDNDTLKINFLSESYSVFGNYKFKTKEINHILNGTYSSNKFKDFNLLTGNTADNNVATYGGGISSKFSKFYTGFNYIYSLNTQFSGKIKVNNSEVKMGYKMKKKKIDLSCALSIQKTELFTFTPDHTISLKPRVKWSATKKMKIQLDGRFRQLNYGDRRGNSKTTDSFASIGLTKQF